MPETKRRTTTSTAVKQRYIDKTYTDFRAKLRIVDFTEITNFIRSQGWSRADFVKRAYEVLNPSLPSEQTEFIPKILMFFWGSSKTSQYWSEDLPYIHRAYNPQDIERAKQDARNLVTIYSKLDFPTECTAIVMQAYCSSFPFGDPEFITPFYDGSGGTWYYSESTELYRCSNIT